MEKKRLQRVYRDRQVSPEEVIADAKVREKIVAEFPPANRSTPTHSSSLSELLKKSLRECGKPMNRIAAEAGISPLLLERFLAGERDIHMVTADKLAITLGLQVVSE